MLPRLITSFTAGENARYSASDEDCATQSCFFDLQVTFPPAIVKTKLLVDYLASYSVRITVSFRTERKIAAILNSQSFVS